MFATDEQVRTIRWLHGIGRSKAVNQVAPMLRAMQDGCFAGRKWSRNVFEELLARRLFELDECSFSSAHITELGRFALRQIESGERQRNAVARRRVANRGGDRT